MEKLVPLYCPKCGDIVEDPKDKFCEKCGASLVVEQPGAALSGDIGLFDLSRNFYILKEKYWELGSGDILNKEFQPIGHMHRIIFSLRSKIELKETDGTVSATIHRKIISARSAQDLKDPQENLIARIKKKVLSFFRPKFYLEDANGKKLYEAQGKFMGWSFKVKDVATKKIVAEIEKADTWRDIFLDGIFDYSDTYALKILDNTTDRRMLLGFVISIDNVLHDKRD